MPQNVPRASASSSAARVEPERVDDPEVNNRLMARLGDRYDRAVSFDTPSLSTAVPTQRLSGARCRSRPATQRPLDLPSEVGGGFQFHSSTPVDAVDLLRVEAHLIAGLLQRLAVRPGRVPTHRRLYHLILRLGRQHVDHILSVAHQAVPLSRRPAKIDRAAATSRRLMSR